MRIESVEEQRPANKEEAILIARAIGEEGDEIAIHHDECEWEYGTKCTCRPKRIVIRKLHA